MEMELAFGRRSLETLVVAVDSSLPSFLPLPSTSQQQQLLDVKVLTLKRVRWGIDVKVLTLKRVRWGSIAAAELAAE